MIECESDDDSDSDHDDSRPSSRNSTARGVNSSGAKAGVRGVRGKYRRNEQQIDRRLSLLKRVQGGSLPVFDDSRPDPGAGFEVRRYQPMLDPKWFDEPDRNYTVSHEQTVIIIIIMIILTVIIIG